MRRREFVRNLAVISGGTFIKTPVFSAKHNSRDDILKGFIVSDAHFGWQDEDQPSPEIQHKWMEIILNRFPDLDLLIDSGDAHHNGTDRDEERGLWTDIIKNPSKPLPFYYIAGNHEIDHCRSTDPELRCNEMGSVSCRPYYSWDMKGIHFVSMPELVKTIYVNNEIMDWVELDLEVNKDKTTILLSHNQLLDTTSGHEPGYRGILNTNQLWKMMKKYPNVIAWMHGHNHNYEMVKKDGVLFVSNGRIGGFDPSRGAHGEGGIYFEITKDQLIARSYSAEKQKFLTKQDVNTNMHPQYHPNGTFSPDAYIKTKTTVNSAALPSYNYGIGGANTGTRFPVYHHHACNNAKSKLYLGSNQTPTLNEDPDFEYFIRSGRWGDPDKKTAYMGGAIRGAYDWEDPNGIRLHQKQDGSFAVIELPTPNFGNHSYYRVAPGTSYESTVRFDAASGGQTIQIEGKVYDKSGREINKYKSELWTLAEGDTERSFKVHLPGESVENTIYDDPSSDNWLNLSVSINVNTTEGALIIRRVAIEPLSGKGVTKNPVIIIDGIRKEKQGELDSWIKFDIPNPKSARSVCEVHAEGSKRLSWLIRHEGWDWQLRNAALIDNGQSLAFNGFRNKWTHRKEVVFVPANSTTDPFVFKMRKVTKAKVFPLNRGNDQLHFIIEELIEGESYAEVEILNPGKRKFKGKGEAIYSDKERMIVKVAEGETAYVI